MKIFANIKDQTISYYESRNNGTPVFLIHGNSLSSEVFKKQLSSIGQDYRLIIPNLPGHGSSFISSDPEIDYSLNNIVIKLVDFISSFEAKEFYLYGNSLGGHLLINCLPHLKGVKGLAISGTPPLASPPDMAACFLPSPAIPLLFKPELSNDEVTQIANAFCSSSATDTTLIEDSIKNADPIFRGIVGAELMSGKNSDEIEILKEADIPLALIHGEHDGMVNYNYLSQLEINKWDNKVHLIENAGHVPFWENSEGFDKVLDRFIKIT